jgi:hypothetical protein
VVDDLGVVLGRDPGEELLLGLGDAQLVERALDVLGHVVPVVDRSLARREVVVDLVEVDAVQQLLVAPLRHGLGQEGVQRAVAELAHPVRLVLEPGDHLHGLVVEALGRLLQEQLRIGEPVLLAVVDVQVGDAFGGHGDQPLAVAVVDGSVSQS